MYRRLYYGPTSAPRTPKDKDIRKKGPWTDDFIMENGKKLTLRTYNEKSTLKIEGYDESMDVFGGDVVYLLDNKLHRENGPAFFRKYELYLWLKNGKLHRENDEPAIETEDNSVKMWFKNGLKHREYGPAVIRRIGSEYWMNGNYLRTEEEFINDVRKSRLKDMLGDMLDIMDERKESDLHQTLYLHRS